MLKSLEKLNEHILLQVKLKQALAYRDTNRHINLIHIEQLPFLINWHWWLDIGSTLILFFKVWRGLRHCDVNVDTILL